MSAIPKKASHRQLFVHRSKRAASSLCKTSFALPSQRAQRQNAAAGRLLPPRQRGVMMDVDARRPANRPREWASPAGAGCHAPSPRPSCLGPSGTGAPGPRLPARCDRTLRPRSASPLFAAGPSLPWFQARHPKTVQAFGPLIEFLEQNFLRPASYPRRSQL